MEKIVLLTKILICILILGMLACSSDQNTLIIDDVSGVPGNTKAPISVKIKLNKNQAIAAEEGRLGLIESSVDNGNTSLLPAQLGSTREEAYSYVVMIMPDGGPGPRKLNLLKVNLPSML